MIETVIQLSLLDYILMPRTFQERFVLALLLRSTMHLPIQTVAGHFVF